MKIVISLFFLSASFASFSQYRVQINLTDSAGQRPPGNVYIAGSFNNWKAGDEAAKLSAVSMNGFTLSLTGVPAGTYEFKFLVNNWDGVETAGDGADKPNRRVAVRSDTVLYATVHGWRSGKPAPPQVSTASSRVNVLDSAFYMPQLKRTRRVAIYLPKDYSIRRKRYPVLYMHDGQNLFDLRTAPFGEWGVDEFLDSTRFGTCIVVAIDHGGTHRMGEYNPYDHERFGKGEGKRYAAFIAETLKPFIDGRFRTLKGRKHSAVAGSSMGGLISAYIALKYPRAFGTAGVFSPAFWTAPQFFDEASKELKPKLPLKLWLYAGGEEGETMVPMTRKMAALLANNPSVKSAVLIDDAGQHNEPAWRKVFDDFYRFWRAD